MFGFSAQERINKSQIEHDDLVKEKLVLNDEYDSLLRQKIDALTDRLDKFDADDAAWFKLHTLQADQIISLTERLNKLERRVYDLPDDIVLDHS